MFHVKQKNRFVFVCANKEVGLRLEVFHVKQAMQKVKCIIKFERRYCSRVRCSLHEEVFLDSRRFFCEVCLGALS